MKKLRSIVSVLAGISIVGISSMMVYADATSALTQAKSDVVTQLKNIINDVAIPIAQIILVGCLLFAVVKAILSYKRNAEFELGWVIAIVIGLVLITSFKVWGWMFLS